VPLPNLAIWPWGDPHAARQSVLFLPRKPYLPIGTLREVVSYPMHMPVWVDVTLSEALEPVVTPWLVRAARRGRPWALQLSPGEQQRIAFARALVQRPDWSSSTRRLRRLTGY